MIVSSSRISVYRILPRSRAVLGLRRSRAMTQCSLRPSINCNCKRHETGLMEGQQRSVERARDKLFWPDLRRVKSILQKCKFTRKVGFVSGESWEFQTGLRNLFEFIFGRQGSLPKISSFVILLTSTFTSLQVNFTDQATHNLELQLVF